MKFKGLKLTVTCNNLNVLTTILAEGILRGTLCPSLCLSDYWNNGPKGTGTATGVSCWETEKAEAGGPFLPEMDFTHFSHLSVHYVRKPCKKCSDDGPDHTLIGIHSLYISLSSSLNKKLLSGPKDGLVGGCHQTYLFVPFPKCGHIK